MTLRLPESLRRRRADDLLRDPFQEETAAERVASLVRLNRALAEPGPAAPDRTQPPA